MQTQREAEPKIRTKLKSPSEIKKYLDKALKFWQDEQAKPIHLRKKLPGRNKPASMCDISYVIQVLNNMKNFIDKK